MDTPSLTVLLVDDSESRLQIHTRIVAGEGYRVLTAENGTDALRIVQEQPVDIILLDVVLPDISGVDVCRRLKADPRTYAALILLISSIEIKSLSQSHGLDSGADGYLVLPVSNQELLSRIRALERIKRSEDELRRSHRLIEQHARELERINDALQMEVMERRRTEEALITSERYARSIINCSLDMIITVDNERRIVEFNDAAQRTFGYTREEVVGKHINILYADADEGKRIHLTTVDSGSVRSEVLNRKKNGETFTSRIAASVLRNEEQQLLGIVGVSRDVTEQKQAEEALLESEERYRLLFTQSPLGILHIDPSGVILHSNRTATEIFGLPREQRTPATIYEQLRHPKLIGAIVGSLNGIPGSYQGEFTSPETQREFTLRFITRAVTTRGRAAGSVIAIVEDITDQTVVQRQLIQSQKLESLGMLAGGIAHDFNNLLSMILGNAELLRRNVEQDPKLRKYVEGIIEVAHRGGSISKQMLSFSRRSEYSLQPIPLSAIVEELSMMLQHFIPKSVTISVSVEGTNDLIQCDKGHIHQVIINLCINAKDAMDGRGALTITQRSLHSSAIAHLLPEIPEGQYVSLAVSDTGPGMSRDVLDRIFDPFFTTKAKGKGTGLGLSIVNGIVRSHNGFIHVTSSVGTGTTFTLYFPAITAMPEAPAHRETVNMNGKRVLIVDDAPLVGVLTEILQEHGIIVMSAPDGIRALELLRLRSSGIDAVIAEHRKSMLPGSALHHELRALGLEIPVIISSGLIDPLIRSQLLKEGVHQIVQKPFRSEEIMRSLTHVLIRRSAV
ncbi:MAG: PAS domain S-box protein [Bacteroidetes bacterium]|nr:PAS domain S-box protein [Bacteroidota bacterium]